MLPSRVLGLLLLLPLAMADTGYVCPTTQCTPPACFCASSTPPLLPASSIPQFVVLTNDDAMTVITTPAIMDMLDKAGRNRNGCPLPCTWFVSIDYTQPEYVQLAYMNGHEIATHTMHHTAPFNVSEIVGARTWLNETARVPLGKIRGFRCPFLAHDPSVRAILQQYGFGWDSSITSTWAPGLFSPDSAHQTWPFTMDWGIPLDCDATGTGNCSTSERWPGLWEFPLWNVQLDDGTVVASMDPAPYGDQPNITALYIGELQRAYASNRRPMGVYLHAARLVGSQEVADQYTAFFKYALSLPDVWVVTVSEASFKVLRWMADPVPAARYSLSCAPPTDMAFPGGRFCLPPSGGCIQGNWSAAACACSCINQASNLPGFCPDPDTGACTAVKQYNFTTKTYYCESPNGTAAETGTSPSPPAAASPIPSPNPSSSTSPSPAASPSPTTTSAGPSPFTVKDASLNSTNTTTSTGQSPSSVDVQPLAGVRLTFVVQASMADFAQPDELDAVCAVVATLASEASRACTVAAVTEAAGPATVTVGAARRLAFTEYLQVSLVINAAAHSQQEVVAALSAAQVDGRLAAALQTVGVQLATPVEVLSAAVPSGSKASVGAAVGGSIGGVALVGLAVAVFLVQRARRRQHWRDGLPVTEQDAHRDEREGPAKLHKPPLPGRGLSLTVTAVPSRLGEAASVAYASSPRSTAMPRHGAFGADL